ncbi:hypothetical protein Hanom_Chr08g00736131 [Helianthus anomalus]
MGALMAHFALRTPLESRLYIFDRVRVLKHMGCKYQVAGKRWRVTWQAGTGVHQVGLRAPAHGH